MVVRTTTRSSSCKRSPSRTPTQKSSGVASCEPSTSPTEGDGESCMRQLPSQQGCKPAMNQAGVSETTPEMLFEGADGHQVLGGTGVTGPRRDETRDDAGGQLCKSNRLVDSNPLG